MFDEPSIEIAFHLYQGQMATPVQNSEGIFVWTDSFCPSLIFLSWVFWCYVHRYLSPKIPYFFLPPSCWAIHAKKLQAYKMISRNEASNSRKNSPSAPSQAASSSEDLCKYFVTSRANSTAFLHAVLVTPMAFAVVWVVVEAGFAELEAREGAFHHVSYDNNFSAVFTRARRLLWDWGNTFAFWNKRSLLLDCVGKQGQQSTIQRFIGDLLHFSAPQPACALLQRVKIFQNRRMRCFQLIRWAAIFCGTCGSAGITGNTTNLNISRTHFLVCGQWYRIWLPKDRE